jgi:hypothetical protein
MPGEFIIAEVSMKTIPKIEHATALSVTPVLRTDFSDDAAWDSVSVAIQEPDPLYGLAHVTCISDPDYDGLTVDALIPIAPEWMTFIFIADRIALTSRTPDSRCRFIS